MVNSKSPLTGEFIGMVELTRQDQLSGMMDRGRQAQKIWASLSLKERLQFITSLRKYLVEEGESISRQVAKITGKPVLEAYSSEILPTIEILHYYEKNGEKILSDKKVSAPAYMPLKKNYIQYRPLGTILVISPWNYPFTLSMIPLVSALIAGNGVILKPASETIYTGKIIQDIFTVLNFPKDLIQVVYTEKNSGMGAELIDLKPDKIFFTGSTATGKKVLKQAAEHMIPVELELGGKDPLIVFKDANLERAATAAVWGAFTNSGQVCMSVERAYVEQEIYDEFITLVKSKIGELWQGTEPYADLGCMISQEQTAVVKEQLEDAKDKGAKVYAKGVFLDESTFVPAMLLTGVNHDMEIMKEETFGPILPVMTFRTEEEAVALANDSAYGLAASIFTSDMDKAKRVAGKIRAGNININEVMASIANPRLPFGGVKNSGMGRYHGEEGLKSFTETVSLLIDTGVKNKEIQWFPYSKNKMTLIKKMIKFLKK